MKYSEQLNKCSKSPTAVIMCGLAIVVLCYTTSFINDSHPGIHGRFAALRVQLVVQKIVAVLELGLLEPNIVGSILKPSLTGLRRDSFPKLLQGNNLVSHINIDVIKSVNKIIYCLCNSLNLLQPLNIAAWPAILIVIKSSFWKNELCHNKKMGMPLKEF